MNEPKTYEKPSLAFPALGTILFTKPWNEIAKTHGNGVDRDTIAQKFRNWCKDGGIPLNKDGIEKTFEGFCKRCKL